MKTLKLLFLILILSATNSCSVDDDILNQPTIYGTWSLVEVSGTIAGITHEFDYGTVTWDFTPSSIIVENNNPNSDLIDKFETGSYPFQIFTMPLTENECVQTIAFSADDLNCLRFDNHTMFITQNAADGITLKLIR